MENITISMRRFEELLYKEAAYEMKVHEIMTTTCYVSEVDRVLFSVPEKPVEPEAEDF